MADASSSLTSAKLPAKLKSIQEEGAKMPIYEYLCPECKHKFEVRKPFDKAGQETHCPKCGKVASRLFSRFASFSKDSAGVSSPIAGTDSSCAGCTASNCSSCGS